MTNIGIVEGFFGPAWTHQARLDFADFLHKHGGDFYIYAPKRDAHLRKSWRDNWDEKYLSEISTLRDAYQNKKIKFGLALSPFGLGSKVCESDWEHLKSKFKQLSDLKIDYLGLFFDDMPSTDDLLKVQSEVVSLALNYFPQGLIFCPSYYTFDPILDKVFGQRPVGYVEGLKSFIPQNVEICWTGPKVISEEITASHLEEICHLIGRKPFIWENLYANDGPRNCKFLKLKYFTGRDDSINLATSAVGFNLMNQPYLSQLVFHSSLGVIRENLKPEAAFEKSCYELLPVGLALLIIENRNSLLSDGLDKFSQYHKDELLNALNAFNDPYANEIREWLHGVYLVGPECLTD
jgi:hyaluronoglucosaminidase